MKTLNKKHTSQLFTTPDGYALLKARWSKLVNDPDAKPLSGADHLWYLILRGKNYQKAFFPGKKMEHYNVPQGLYDALMSYSFQKRLQFDNVFGDILVEDWRGLISQIIPSCYTQNHYESEPYITEQVEALFGKAEPQTTANSTINRVEVYAEANA
jgi:hypothetical protein